MLGRGQKIAEEDKVQYLVGIAVDQNDQGLQVEGQKQHHVMVVHHLMEIS